MFRRVLLAMLENPDFRLVVYSLQSNHVHLVVEIDRPDALTQGMRSLLARLVAQLHRLWGCRGSLFPTRFHARALVTPMEVRYALLYVLNNRYKHGAATSQSLDPYASGAWFSGWRESFTIEGIDDIPQHLSPPETWLLKTGWRKHGRIRLAEPPVLSTSKRSRPRRSQ